MKKEVRTVYLYSDGHAVVRMRKHDPDAGDVEWVEVFERFGPECRFNGRLVIGPYGGGMMNLARKARCVRVIEPDVNNGSDHTKEKGIRLGYIKFKMHGGDELTWWTMPDLITGECKHQPDCNEAFDPNIHVWAGEPVRRVHGVKREAEVVAA